jgi:hypothetical protein
MRAEQPGPNYRGMRTPDAARRMAEQIALHQVALTREEILAKRFIAIRLSDGGSDGVAYDTRDDAIRHQLHETLCGYFQVPLERWSPETCDSLLWYVRKRYDAGYRAKPGSHLILPTNIEEYLP